MSKIVIIGSSTGGPLALECIIRDLPENLGVPVLIAQHMPAVFTNQLAKRLDNICALPVVEAEHKKLIKENCVYIVPGENHFFFEKPGPRVHLLHESKGLSPSIDMSMISAVDHYGPGVIGVILTGMGKDGLVGAKAIKQFNGAVIVESKETAVIFGMPKAVFDANLADEILPIDKIAEAIVRRVKI